jgi:hypothetical protein
VKFFCPCPEKHALKLVHPSGEEGKRPFTPYFAHITNGAFISCAKRGESLQHQRAKHLLKEMQGRYGFYVNICPKCKNPALQYFNDGSVSLEVSSNDGKWRYDCMYYQDGEPMYALEVYHKHATSAHKVSSTFQCMGVKLVEFRADEVIAKLDHVDPPSVMLDNLKMERTLCRSCVEEADTAWMYECYSVEVNALHRLENGIFREYCTQWLNCLERKSRQQQAQKRTYEEIIASCPAPRVYEHYYRPYVPFRMGLVRNYTFGEMAVKSKNQLGKEMEGGEIEWMLECFLDEQMQIWTAEWEHEYFYGVWDASKRQKR